jgi:uncharacterized SAM-binding protein YcdF (DUF218 family)
VVLEVLKEQFHLTSPVWILIILAVGTVWLWRRPGARGPRLYFAAAGIGYWFLMSPIGAGLLVSGLGRGLTPIASRDQAGHADVVVVLGGGASTAIVGGEVGGALSFPSLLRALEGARVFKLIGARTLIVSGGIPRPDRQVQTESELLRDIVVKAGVPPSAVVQESQSKSTRDQVRFIGPILRDHQSRQFVLVTSPMHMRRSLAVFRAAGFDPVASVAPVRSEHVVQPRWLIPNDGSFALSDAALYDYIALLYYWSRGWMKSPDPHE